MHGLARHVTNSLHWPEVARVTTAEIPAVVNVTSLASWGRRTTLTTVAALVGRDRQTVPLPGFCEGYLRRQASLSSVDVVPSLWLNRLMCVALFHCTFRYNIAGVNCKGIFFKGG